MKWDADQRKAIDLVNTWLTKKDKQIFRLFGYAGTGKSTIAKHLVEGFKGQICYGSFMAKAALVMRHKGMPASTLHSLTYTVEPPGEENGWQLKFHLNHDSELRRAKLLVVDEVSTVGSVLGKDIQSFGIPILVLGDPGQLPPIDGAGYFTEQPPDMMLTEPHRFARDNPIIDIATRIRKMEEVPRRAYGDSSHIPKKDFRPNMLDGDVQLIVGMNKTRRIYNRIIRDRKDFSGVIPQKGETLICLKNDYDYGLFNGLAVTVDKVISDSDPVKLSIKSEEHTNPFIVPMARDYFTEYVRPGTLNLVELYKIKDLTHFDFGYAITCHKALGSQWPEVCVYYDGMYSGDKTLQRRWLYTGVTRAENRVMLVS